MRFTFTKKKRASTDADTRFLFPTPECLFLEKTLEKVTLQELVASMRKLFLPSRLMPVPSKLH